jgi:uncharacterized protein involved in response to NO
LGFRLFYLGAALFAVIAIPLWVGLFLDQWQLTMALPPLQWHAHEMLFGFAVAVILGFLLTAVKAWTGLATARGVFLGVLASLWLAARVAAVTGPYSVHAVLDLLLPLVAVVLTRVLLRARNRRNLPLAGMLMLLALANGAFHLSVIGFIDLAPITPLYAALALIGMIECVITGRVIAAFALSATLALRAKALLLWVIRHRPILWILHLACAWVPLGLALLAMTQFGWITTSAGVHALAIGATAGLIIGLVTRTARGHTERALQLSRPETVAYVLVMVAASVRVLLPRAVPQWLPLALVITALAWSLAFAL